nr:MAG TPA: hypothetical protein [Caudoviricetes sp.]
MFSNIIYYKKIESLQFFLHLLMNMSNHLLYLILVVLTIEHKLLLYK